MFESVEAIAFKHRAEPSLKTVYVEGPTDIVFYKKCLSVLKLNKVSICDIKTVDTTKLDFETFHLDHKSNRDKVIRFICEIRSKHGLTMPVGVIDADFDHVKGVCHGFEGVYATDFSCAEAYFWEREAFVEFLDRVTKNQFTKHSDIIGNSLNAIFALRLVNLEYKVEMSGTWLDKFSLKGGFLHKDYSRNIIIRSGRAKEINIGNFCDRVDTVIASIERHQIAINGHDMADLLCNIMNLGKKVKSIQDPSLLLDILYSLDCYPDIVKMPMFKALAAAF